MNTTDEQFRSDLAEALDASAHDVAPFDVSLLVDAGARKVRQRRAAAGAGLAAGVIALAGGSWAVLNLPGPPRVAAPAPSPSPTPSEVSFPGNDPEDPNASLGTQVQFVARVVAGSPTPVHYYRVTDGVEELLASVPLPAAGTSLVLHSEQAPNSMIVLVPDDATSISLLGTGGSVSYVGGDRLLPLPGTALKAELVQVVSPATSFDASAAVLWWRADGVPVTNDEVGFARWTTLNPGGEVSTWVLPRAQRGGIRSLSDGVGSYTNLENRDPLTVLTTGFWTSYGGPDEETYSQVHLFAGIVPGTISDVAITYDDERLVDRVVESQPWPEAGGTLVVGRAVLPPQPGRGQDDGSLGFTGMTWTDAHGVRQEWKND